MRFVPVFLEKGSCEEKRMLKDLDLFTTTEDEAQVILKDLHKQGCCPRCVLRFLGERRPSSYTLSEQELHCQYIQPSLDKETVGEGELNPLSTHKCPACLGILQGFTCPDFYQQVMEKVKEADHEFRDYQLSLMLPVATILRQHAVFVYLVQKYGSPFEEKEEQIASIKDVFKWSAGPSFSKLLGVPFQMRSSFDILLNLSYKPSDHECRFLLDTFPDIFRRRKVKKGEHETFTRASVLKVIGEMTPSDFSRKFSCPPCLPDEGCTCDISVSYDSVFVAGRYQKYSRVLSQTPWVIDGVTKMEGSVQELVCQVILERFRPTDHKFSASGREDVDVQMLGLGRPFVVELINPHRVFFSPEELKAMQKETNARSDCVGIRDLQIVTREQVGKLKEGEEDKSKSYVALCWCERPLTSDDREKLDSSKDLVLHQKTPIRVLHRRTLATRERTIYSMKVESDNDLQFKLHLSTQAGTYVKEFVHGDFGRTQPNLRTLLGADCDILALDVTAVNVDWPPRIDPDPQEGLENGAVQETGARQRQTQPHCPDHSQPSDHCEMETPEAPA